MATLKRTRDRLGKNAGFAAAVIVVHAAIMLAFLTRSNRSDLGFERVSQWMEPDANTQVESPPIVVPSPATTTPRLTIDPPTLAPIELDGGLTPNWTREAELGAQAVVDGIAATNQRRDFGPQPRAAPQKPQTPFFEQPKHKLGDLDEDYRGENIVWLNERCYMTLDKRLDKDVGRPTIESAPKQWCLFPVGDLPARGDLFKDMPSRRRCAPDDQACIDSIDISP